MGGHSYNGGQSLFGQLSKRYPISKHITKGHLLPIQLCTQNSPPLTMLVKPKFRHDILVMFTKHTKFEIVWGRGREGFDISNIALDFKPPL